MGDYQASYQADRAASRVEPGQRVGNKQEVMPGYGVGNKQAVIPEQTGRVLRFVNTLENAATVLSQTHQRLLGYTPEVGPEMPCVKEGPSGALGELRAALDLLEGTALRVEQYARQLERIA